MSFSISKLLLAVVPAAAVVAGLVLLGGGGDDDGSSMERTPTPEPSGPIRFVLDDEYTVSERVAVQIENRGTHSYRYVGTSYAACFLRYFDSAGREFKIPPGTHCDLIVRAKLKPGETVRLFTWRLDECIKDRWGCVRRRPLPPGTYVIRGRFRATDGAPPAKPEATFRIVDS